MKKYLIIIWMIAGLASCEKGEEFRAMKFPGFTGAGNEAVWVVYSHVVSDVPYITSVMPTQNPPSTFAAFDASLTAARQREVSPFSFKLYSSGEVALIGKDVQNQNTWVKQNGLKWEASGETMNISRNVSGNWVNIIVCYIDQNNLLFRFRKAYFGETSAEKDKPVVEVVYTIFK